MIYKVKMKYPNGPNINEIIYWVGGDSYEIFDKYDTKNSKTYVIEGIRNYPDYFMAIEPGDAFFVTADGIEVKLGQEYFSYDFLGHSVNVHKLEEYDDYRDAKGIPPFYYTFGTSEKVRHFISELRHRKITLEQLMTHLIDFKEFNNRIGILYEFIHYIVSKETNFDQKMIDYVNQRRSELMKIKE